MSRLQIAVNNIVSGLTGAVVSIRDIFRYEGSLTLIDFTSDDDIPNLRAVKALIGSSTIVNESINAGGSSTYPVNSIDLAVINGFGRYPNFVAVVAGAITPDIQPTFSGVPGSFSAISIGLHNDGTGVNPDDTEVQFS
jgi:hypothetical protein